MVMPGLSRPETLTHDPTETGRVENLAPIIDLDAARERTRFDFIKVQNVKRLVSSAESDELGLIGGRSLSELAEAFDSRRIRNMSELSELQDCLFEDGRLWLRDLLDLVNVGGQVIPLRDTHLVTTRTKVDFVYSVCSIELCQELGVHVEENWLSLPLTEQQPLVLKQNGLREICLTPRVSQDFGDGVRSYAETLGNIFGILQRKFKADQRTNHSWD